MAGGADCASGTAAKRRQPAGRKSRASQHKKTASSRVSLEKVLGISTASGSGLASDPITGLIAYPAGCVVVLLHPKKNKQSHIINTSRRRFSAVAFSNDGKHLVTGESGHMPCVRVWEVGGAQVAEVQSHKYGVSCVAFSTNSCYIVSVGYQHDMTVSVWDWRKGSIIASNKVSSRVFAVSFSQDNSYFVTAGNRHVKFWYLDASKKRRVNSTVPLIGRSGLLGDHKNSVFSGVACGRGLMASSTYCITSSSLLCVFNSGRQLEAWVNLKTAAASCLSVSEDFIFCGCADGVVRVFSPSNLQYITTLHRPHRLGVDLSCSVKHGSLSPTSPGAHYPDTLALTFDPAAKLLTCVYNDHSVYVWDVKDVRNVGKLYSALYHSSSVWSVEVYPELSDASQACLPPSSFFTCSSDNTIRLWLTDSPTGHRSHCSNDLVRILYVGENTQHLHAEGDKGDSARADGKAGIRVLGISPDGQHLAAGDRCGNLHIFSLAFLEELVKIEAHDSEVLCLAFSPTSTGVKLLASASRDRLIHIFNLEKNYSLEQTLNDHSASVTAVRFTGQSPDVGMVSCGADKSIYFQTAERTPEGLSFSRSHHVVEKTTLYDMDLDSSQTRAAIACQDRNIRVYNVQTGKLKQCLKGSSGDEGALLKVQMDPSGSFFATSCSDKNISIFDYESGECLATLFGHAEIVTCMRFSQDCRHLITVAGDSCVFVWRLDSHMTSIMRKRRGLQHPVVPDTRGLKHQTIRRETFTVPSSQLPRMEEEEEEQAALRTPARLDSAEDPPLLQTNGKLPMWFRRLQGQEVAAAAQSDAEPRQVRSRWAEHLDPLIICSNYSPSQVEEEEEEEEEAGEEEGDFHPQSLESLLEGEVEVLQSPGEDPTATHNADADRDVGGVTAPQPSLSQLKDKGQGVEPVWSTKLSPDSTCSEGSAGSVEQQQDADTDSLSQGSSVGSLCLEDDEDRNSLKNHFDTLASGLSDEEFNTDPRTLQPPEEKHFLNPRLSISSRFLSRFQDRIRMRPSRAPPPVSIQTRISEESNISNTSASSTSSGEATSSQTTQNDDSGEVRRNRSVRHRRASCTISHQPLRRPIRRRHTAVFIQCEDMQDARSRSHGSSVTSASQQGAPLLGYLGTTVSSRAKLSQDAPTSSSQEEKKLSSSDLRLPVLLSTEGDTQQEQSSSIAPSSQTFHPHAPGSPQVLATPTAVMSLGGVRRWSISSVEDQNQTLIQSPARSLTPMDTVCDITASPASVQGGGAENKVSTDPESSSDPPVAASSPLSQVPRPPAVRLPGSDEDEDLLQCHRVADELQQAAGRAVRLQQQLSVSADGAERLHALSVLRDAIDAVASELQVALQGTTGTCLCRRNTRKQLPQMSHGSAAVGTEAERGQNSLQRLRPSAAELHKHQY